jgi:uncharacterized protein (TIGR03435 family)
MARSQEVVLTTFLFSACLVGYAQQAREASSSAAAFEVASVKRSAPDARGMLVSGPAPSGFRTLNAPLSLVIQYAFGIADYQLVDGPPWVRSDRFDITTKYPEGDDQRRVPEMVQALLADRFALKVHREVREGPIFALEIVRDDRRVGPKLRPTEIDCVAFYAALKESGKPNIVGPDGRPTCNMISSNQFIRASSRTIDQLAGSLARQVGRKVENRTGLSGNFDFDLEWSPEFMKAPPPGNVSAPSPGLDDNLSIYTALREQLGLELKAATGSIDVVVIDSVSPPTLD